MFGQSGGDGTAFRQTLVNSMYLSLDMIVCFYPRGERKRQLANSKVDSFFR